MEGSDEFFMCRPETYCSDCAICCALPLSRPQLSLGDYSRLTEFTGMGLQNIWEEYGDVSLYKVRMSPSERGWNSRLYQVSLGLEHNPCPYLQDNRCYVHNEKPIACRVFPDAHIMSPLTVPKISFSCIRNKKIKNPKMIRALIGLHRREIAITNDIMFDGMSLHIDLFENLVVLEGDKREEYPIGTTEGYEMENATRIARKWLDGGMARVFEDIDSARSAFKETTDEYRIICQSLESSAMVL